MVYHLDYIIDYLQDHLKKAPLGDLLKKKNKPAGERSPSPMIEENPSRRRRRRRSRSLSSTGSGQWSRSSSLSNKDDRISRVRYNQTMNIQDFTLVFL